MLIQQRRINAQGLRFSLTEKGKEVARAFLYLLTNEMHAKPFGFLEEVYVKEEQRGKGYGQLIVKAVIKEAKKRGCYKLISTSGHANARKATTDFYQRLGFKDSGKEFRIELN